MRIQKYGIVLESMGEQDLELVRQWRNTHHVRRNMQYQEIISPDMQSRWYGSLDKKSNLYFIICQNAQKIGVINLKDIDSEKMTAEAGIFIGVSDFLNSIAPVAATLLLMEFAFETLKLKDLRAKIGVRNYKVIRFNEDIGYRKDALQRDENFHYYSVRAEDFYLATKTIRETLEKM